MESAHGIGRVAAESGLTISALRFYDRAGLLVPARVDPHTGYRYYTPEQVAVARLVAVLRRAGMPLAGIRAALACRHDPVAVDRLLAEHVSGLERDLAEARRVLSSVRSLLEPRESPMSTFVTLPASELVAALRAVRFAVGTDPELPALCGVLFDVGPGAALTVVASDRYRLACSTVAVAVDGPAVAAVVPAAVVDEILAAVAGDVTLVVDGRGIEVRSVGAPVTGRLVAEAFPDYRLLLGEGGPAVTCDAAQLRSGMAAAQVRPQRRDDGVEFPVARLALDAGGGLVALGGDADAAGVAVNRDFLIEALDAGDAAQLDIAIAGDTAPIAIRSARSMSLLMPVRI